MEESSIETMDAFIYESMPIGYIYTFFFGAKILAR